MRVSAGNPTAVLRCNTANSSSMIDGKFEILNKRIDPVQVGKGCVFNSALHLHSPLPINYCRAFYRLDFDKNNLTGASK